MAINKLKRTFKKVNKYNFVKEYSNFLDTEETMCFSSKDKPQKRKFEVINENEDAEESSQIMETKLKHKAKKRKLKVASDQEDSDDQDVNEGTKGVQTGQVVVSLKMVKKWEMNVQENIHKALKVLSEAFKAVVQSNESKEDEKEKPSMYFVKTSNVSDAIINACIVELIPAVIEHLDLPEMKSGGLEVLPSSSCKWKKIKPLIKPYLMDLLKLLDQMTNADLLTNLMKHTFQVTSMFVCFPKLIKPFIRKLIDLWSSSSDTVRIMCFRCLFIVIVNANDKIAKHIFLNMYLMAMKNSQFTTVNSLPAINYMKTSLIDLYFLRPNVAYECIYRSLQQVSMYLLGVLNQKNRRKTQLINWRFCHSLSIFSNFIGKTKDDENINKLIHNVSEIILGTTNLYHSPSYIPMWLFCARILIQLMKQTGHFIQILPVILKPLKTTLFDKTPKVGKMKSCVFSVCLRMNKKELKEKAFQDEVIDEIFELLITYSSSLAHKLTFPELILGDLFSLKEYIKRSKASIYIKKFKQALDKIQKRSKEIEKIRNTRKINLKDLQSLTDWEKQLKEEGCELTTFCECWIKTRLQILELQTSNKDQICTDDLPTIKRPESKKATEEDRERFKTLFKFGDDSDEDDEDDGEEEHNSDIARFQQGEDNSMKKFARVQKLKQIKAKHTENGDSYSDFDEDELELLARSPVSGEEYESSSNADEPESDLEDEVENDEDDCDEDEPDTIKELNLDEESNDGDGSETDNVECDSGDDD